MKYTYDKKIGIAKIFPFGEKPPYDKNYIQIEPPLASGKVGGINYPPRPLQISIKINASGGISIVDTLTHALENVKKFIEKEQPSINETRGV